MNAPAPPPPPPRPPLPDPAPLVQAVGEIVGRSVDAITETVKQGEAFGAAVEGNLKTVQERVNDIVNNASAQVQDILGKLKVLAEAVPHLPEPPPMPPAVNPQFVLCEIARAVCGAEEILNFGVDAGKGKVLGGGMVIASGEIALEMIVSDPAGVGKAQVRATIRIEPKPIT